MKLLVVISIIACSYAAQLDKSYLPPPGATAAGGSPGSITGPRGGTGDQGFGPTSSPGLNQPGGTAGSFGQPAAQYGPPSGASGSPLGSFGFSSIQSARGQYQPERARASIDRNAETLRYDNRIDGDTFAYSFETSNGITAEESGIATNGVQAQGAFAYTGDDGQIYRVTYTADKNGYQPQGDHLPTPPPIPEEILRSIEENARAAAAGTQEGAYNPNEDTLQSNQQYTGSSNFGSDQDISRSDTGTINSFSNQNQGVVVGQSGYQAPGSSGGVQSAAAGYQQQAPTQQYNAPNAGGSSGTFTATQGTFGATQPTIGSSRPDNQYIPPATGQGYNPASFGSTQTVQIGSQSQYSAPSTRPTATGPVPSPTASGPSPSGFAPATSAGPTNPTSYTSSNPSTSPFAVSNATPTGFAPAGSTVSGPSPSSSALSGPSARPSDFAPSNPTASSTRPNNSPSAGVQISEYSKAGQVTPQNDDGYNYDRPQPGFGDSRTQVPAGSQRPTSSSEQGFIINVQGSTGTTSPDQYQTNKPFGSRTSMSGAAGYKYKRPGTQSRAPGASGAGKSDNGRSGLAFGGPRQPPSFSQDDGYKY